MKKKFLTIVGVAAFAVTVVLNINAGFKSDTVSDLALANVDALAQGEGGGTSPCAEWCPLEFCGYHYIFGY